MSQWYYADDAYQRQGPLEDEELARLQREGRVRGDSLVWREGMAEWRPLAEFAAEFPAAGDAAAPALDLGTGQVVDSTAGSPGLPPATPLSYATSAALDDTIVLAGFWKRYAAYFIDGMLLGVVGYAVQLPLLFIVFGSMGGFGSGEPASPDFGPAMVAALVAAYLVPILIQMLYYAWFHSSRHQATVGKMAIGIKVTDEGGRRISFARGVGRYFAFLLSGFTIGIGYLMAAFTERKQALHDMIVSTLVVDRWAYTDRPDLQRRELGAVTVVVIVVTGVFMLLAIAVAVFAIAMFARQGWS